MRVDTFVSLSFLDQILSAEFLSKGSKLFWGKNWHQSGYFDTLPSLLSLLNVALGASKNGHFSFFQRSCQLGLSQYYHTGSAMGKFNKVKQYLNKFWSILKLSMVQIICNDLKSNIVSYYKCVIWHRIV